MAARPSPRQVIGRRRTEQEALVARARRFAVQLDDALGVRAVVVFGSVARGDFHNDSDVDVLVVADHLPDRALDRNAALGIPPPGVEFVAWTAVEWRLERDRGNPIAVEAAGRGVIVAGGLP